MNLNLQCRVCLETGMPIANIFKHKRNGKTFSEMLMDCAPVTIKKYDGLPCNICSDCIEKLIAGWNVREKILNTESKLRRTYCKIPTDMSVVKAMSFNSPCRVCLETGMPFANIFKHKRNGRTFSEMLMDCTRVTITENDQLPCNICSNCIEKLIALWNFREKILNAESKLCRTYCRVLTDMSIVKEEPSVTILENTDYSGEMIQLKIPTQLMTVKMLQYIPNLCRKLRETVDSSKGDICQRKSLLDHDYLKESNETIKDNDSKKNKEELKVNNIGEVHQNTAKTKNDCNSILENINSISENINRNNLQIEDQQQQHLEKNCFNKNNVLLPEQPLFRNNDSANHSFIPPVILPTTLPPIRDVVPPEILRKPRTVFCQACDKSFCYRYYYNVHVAHHVSKNRISCDVCGKLFVKQYQLNAHKKIHSNKKLPCDICGKILKTEQSLGMHKKMHIIGKPYQCNLCEKAFTAESYLKLHILRHNGEKNFMCELCGKSFGCENTLKTHLSSHNTERTLPCPTCGKLFTSKRRLQVHCRRHTSNRPHVCELCGKAFKLKQGIRRHVLVHFDNPMGDKVHSCRICGKVFKDSSSIPRHMLTHTGETPYSCDKCPYSCRYKQQFDRHMRKHK
ncbi:Zinc finger, C2H2 type [Popillia japonica]|uniref:Zinc finger, C2H2 type n=1 Tax=Popillia japonica TaxID=7064 RepID=A0AAW1LHC2_POPJA